MAGLVTHGERVGLYEGNQVIVSSSVTVFDNEGAEIGYIQSLTDTDSRPTTVIRHLNGADAGRPVEQAPAPETHALTASSFALYNVSQSNRMSLLSRIVGQNGKMFSTLQSQHIPFIVHREDEHPSNANEVNSTTWYGCYLTNHTTTTNIGTVTITESCNITPSWKETE